MNNYEKWVGGELPPSTPNKSAFYSPAPKMPYNPHPNFAENEAKLAKIDKQLADAKNTPNDNWLPVSGSFPRLVFETKNRMDDTNAPDMQHGKQDRETIESYGLMQPFKQAEYTSPRDGMTQSGEDQFSLSASEHFKRMRGLARYFSNNLLKNNTSSVFSRMVDKFERNEGGYYMSPYLDEALQSHETTMAFHKALLACLSDNLKDGNLDKNIVSIVSEYMQSEKGKPLPKFDEMSLDIVKGTVLSVHGIWSMQVFVEQLEYKGDAIRGKFKYKVQDHFGLDSNDVDHTLLETLLLKPFEQLDGFRSWYLLQHYQKYDYKPFIAEMRFTL